MTESRSTYLTPKQVADVLGVAPKTITRWCKEGKVAHTKTLGGHVRITLEEFDRLRYTMGKDN